MNERNIEIKVGILVVVALAILAAFVVVLGNFSLSDGFTFSVDFTFSGNLQTGAPVKVAGIKVGKVQQVAYLGGKTDKATGRRVHVRVTAWVEQRVKGTVFRDAEFFINTQGVLGEQYLEIAPGTPRAGAIAPGQVFVGVSPPRMDLVVARLYEVLDGVTRILREDKETIKNLLKNGASALATVDTLLAENRGEIKKLLVRVESFAGEAEGLIKDVRTGVGDPKRIGRLLASVERTAGSLGRQLDGLLTRANSALSGVERITSTVGPKEQQQIRAGLNKLVALADRLHALSGDASSVVSGLSKGKGTAGALLVREELYRDLKEMVRDLKRHPWKFLWRE